MCLGLEDSICFIVIQSSRTIDYLFFCVYLSFFIIRPKMKLYIVSVRRYEHQSVVMQSM